MKSRITYTSMILRMVGQFCREKRQDTSDFEWMIMKSAFKKYWFLLLFQVVCSQFLNRDNKKVLLSFYTLYSCASLLFIVGPAILFLYVAYILLLCIIQASGKKLLCYAVTMAALFLLQQEAALKTRQMLISEQVEGYLVDVGSIWLIAKGLSFCLDRINSNTHSQTSFEHLALVLIYCLYLPTFFTGPLMTYEAFANQISQKSQKKPLRTIMFFIHPIGGFFLLEFLLHFVYSSSVQFYPELVFEFNAWQLCGLGYALSTMFYLKYFVIYSTAGALAKAESIDLPPPPKCISRVHVPTLLWRTFDRGLYIWLLRYLYLPIVEGKWTYPRKVIALALCFAFVCVWHGMDRAVMTWTFLNFINLLLEMMVKCAASLKTCRKYETFFSKTGKKWIVALISTPLFMMMCISSCYFLSNYDIGDLIMHRILFSGLIPLVPTAVIMFCGCIVSLSFKEWEEKVKLRIDQHVPYM